MWIVGVLGLLFSVFVAWRIINIGANREEKMYSYWFRHLEIAFTTSSANPVKSPEIS